jgi:hypothetical protein
MKLMISTPAYAGNVSVPYAISLSETTYLLLRNNIEVQHNIQTSGSLLVAERNRIVQVFMESDCTHVLMIDADLGWPAQAVISMLLAQKEFICGIYPSRGERCFTFRPSVNEDQSIVSEKNLLKMEYIPAGFMLISREAIQKMRDKFPELYYEPKAEANKHMKGWCLFNTEVWEGEFWGEDYYFCRKAREAGIDIWTDPQIQFNHAVSIVKLIDSLTDKKEEASQPDEKISQPEEKN